VGNSATTDAYRVEVLGPIADSSIDLVPVLADDPAEHTIALEPGDVLFRQQSIGSRVYLIESGRLAIVREPSECLVS
jgi:hypothetical protein